MELYSTFSNLREVIRSAFAAALLLKWAGPQYSITGVLWSRGLREYALDHI
jgi:hypothetical protein